MQLVNLSEFNESEEYIYSNIIDKLQTIDHQNSLVIAGSDMEHLDVTIRKKAYI